MTYRLSIRHALSLVAFVPLLVANTDCDSAGEEPGPGSDGGTDECVCPEVFAPVCGEDGETYENECKASCAGVAVAHEGVCDDDPTCPPVTCYIYCEHGFETDDDGCPICSCLPPPPPEGECLVDDDCEPDAWCDTSQCLPAPGCDVPDADCPAGCYGECRRSDPPAPPPPGACHSEEDCGDGEWCNIEDCADCDDGSGDFECPAVCIGTCEPRTCPEARCFQQCEHGFEPDDQGCPTCDCRPEPTDRHCFSDDDCGPMSVCDLSECHSPCTGDDDESCAAVCAGLCVVAEP